ncbi:MAG: efflux RND transporter periplasmic adaptor subunit [Planctomycetaceae bacterium]|jgi:RND family efflux transporter MFP subunit|nr:efflux RND transporter periplasmic adaptor subunit [Planctomycetaceae bacterium]
MTRSPNITTTHYQAISNKTSGGVLVWILVPLVVIGVTIGAGYYAWSRYGERYQEAPPQMITAKREFFVHEILERGSVDSAVNIEVRCEVESAGGLTIISVIPEGTIVKKGDLLVELDSSTLRENVVKQQITVNNSQSTVAKSEADLRTAELTFKEYDEGKYLESRKTIENKIDAAKEKERNATANVNFNQRLLQRGYITEIQAQADEFALRQANNELEAALLELEVLNKYTREKTNTQNQASIDSAKAKLSADRRSLELETERLSHLEEQLTRCKILAPQDGQVVYFQRRWGGEDDVIKEGKKVYEREVLIRLPDPSQMQVQGLVNEANIRLVKVGQRATVKLEAFANQEFAGDVRTVNDYPERGGWMGGTMSKEYMTKVKINEPPAGIKPGLTAEVRIVVNEIPDALTLPVQAVFEYQRKMHVVTYDNGKWGMKEVKIGPTNDKQVVVLEGVTEGEQVVLGAWQHREKLNLKEEPKEGEGENGKNIETEKTDVVIEPTNKPIEPAKTEASSQEVGKPEGNRQEAGRPAGGNRPDGGTRPGTPRPPRPNQETQTAAPALPPPATN